MNESKTLQAAPGQLPGKLAVSAITRLERAGGRVIAHLGRGAQVLLDITFIDPAAPFSLIGDFGLEGFVSIDKHNWVRGSTIARMRRNGLSPNYEVLLRSGEILLLHAEYAYAVLEQLMNSLEQRYRHVLGEDVGMPQWPIEAPAGKAETMDKALAHRMRLQRAGIIP